MAFKNPAETLAARSGFYFPKFQTVFPFRWGGLRSGQAFSTIRCSYLGEFPFEKYPPSETGTSAGLDSLDNCLKINRHKCTLSTSFSSEFTAKIYRTAETLQTRRHLTSSSVRPGEHVFWCEGASSALLRTRAEDGPEPTQGLWVITCCPSASAACRFTG